ncbi:hypothetical protein [Marinobacter mangrovi]|uniref:hypothetical protein n=1 Tax=Marinobacter mangrovi TaxID=2803918 RepID=UPI001932614E|nr:hypothetical protein [Marinobacter mangrovi]
MNSESFEAIVALVVMIDIFIGLAALAFSLTSGFRKIAEIESRIAPKGSTIDVQKKAWGEGPVGRWIRIVYLLSFFFWRRIPGHGVKVASNLGDIHADVPWRLQCWLVIPMVLFWSSILLMVVGWLLIG